MAAIKRIVEGTQTMTVYKPIALLADKAAEISVALAKDEKPQSNAELNNGLKNVPSYLLEPIVVDKNNIETTIIKDGFHSKDSIYK